MKILCVSDTSDSLAFSRAGLQYCKNPDLVISAGDLPLESYDYLSTVFKCDTYYVFGNHCLQHFTKKQEKQTAEYLPYFYGFSVEGRCLYNQKYNLIIAGLGGSMFYNGGKSQYSEEQMKKRIWQLEPHLKRNKKKYGRYLDILITHAPPFGLGDGEDLCHTGFKCFLTFMEKYSPRYLLHGHIHLIDANTQRIYKYKNTKIINVYGSYILEDNELGTYGNLGGGKNDN